MSSITDLTPGVWNVDPVHSSIEFVARHLMISKVRGKFGDFSGTLTTAADPLQSKVEATAQVASITTGDGSRDTHLKSADFFDVDNNPTMTPSNSRSKSTGLVVPLIVRFVCST